MLSQFAATMSKTSKNKLFRESYIMTLVDEIIQIKFPGFFNNQNLKLSVQELDKSLKITLKLDDTTLLSYIKLNFQDLEDLIFSKLFDSNMINKEAKLVLNFKSF